MIWDRLLWIDVIAAPTDRDAAHGDLIAIVETSFGATILRIRQSSPSASARRTERRATTGVSEKLVV
jgi:hypothetical protein